MVASPALLPLYPFAGPRVVPERIVASAARRRPPMLISDAPGAPTYSKWKLAAEPRDGIPILRRGKWHSCILLRYWLLYSMGRWLSTRRATWLKAIYSRHNRGAACGK